MPRRVEPCVATLVDKPPKGPEWAFEVKWDGYRLAVHVEPGEVRAITRGGYDWTKKFGPIVAEAGQLGHASMILDGEAVVLDEQGRSDFGLLQRAVGKKPSAHDASEIIFYAFDLLYLDGHDLRNFPLSERRRLLEPIVAGRTGAIRFSEEVNADGAEFFRAACELGLEGIIAERRDKPYRSSGWSFHLSHAFEGRMPKLSILRPRAILDFGYQERTGENRPLALQSYRRLLSRDCVEQFAQRDGFLIAPPSAAPSDVDKAVALLGSQQQTSDRARHRRGLIADNHKGIAPRAFDLEPFRPAAMSTRSMRSQCELQCSEPASLQAFQTNCRSRVRRKRQTCPQPCSHSAGCSLGLFSLF
ncbi:ATP dependent DNA ligase domain-containing protein [Sinorhizobium sp. NFACC03]|nr:ATP dependent DNA ligase domain-containing protein [Sinorhizobium sp. NFACC03]